MNKAYIITSCIETNNSCPLTYSPIRSAFSAEERFRQTIFTLTALDFVADANTKIYLIDSSENWEMYQQALSYYPNLTYVSVKKQFPDVFNLCHYHTNKSYAEALTIANFLTNFREELKQFDYFIKLSGRYFFDSHFNTEIFNESNTDKLFFKNPLEFEFDDTWNFQMVDRRQIQGNNKLYWYCSGMFAWGKQYHEKIMDIFRVIPVILNHPSGSHYQFETLLYYFTREFSKDIIHTDWKIIGFDSVSANFLRY